MLTLILLVVLGGGVGILAVSMAERKPAMHDGGSGRAPAAPPAAEPEPDTPVETTPEPVPTPADTVPAPEIGRRGGEPKPTPAPRPAPASTDPQSVDRLPRHRGRGSVPSSQTAVEGRLGDLIRPSLPRRLVSLVGIVVIAVAVGVGIAALAGAVVGGAAEIVGNTIG